MTTTEELWEELDRSAIKLLKEAMGEGGALEGDGSGGSLPAGGSLNEKTRVFSAISAYAKSRMETGPKPKAENAFSAIRSSFHGTNGTGNSPRRRRGAPKGKPVAEANGADPEYDA